LVIVEAPLEEVLDRLVLDIPDHAHYFIQLTLVRLETGLPQTIPSKFWPTKNLSSLLDMASRSGNVLVNSVKSSILVAAP
jgi:hypothetical protein